MLGHVEITNYRGFNHFRMDGLARVNLLVGRNNSGKTTLLEGIQFLTSGGDPAVLAEIAERRGELIVSRPERAVLVDIAHFFHGHVLVPDATILLSGDNGYPPVTMKTILEKPRPEQGASRPERANAPGLYVRIFVNGTSKSDRDNASFRISRDGGVDFEVPSQYRRAGVARRTGGPYVRFVGPDSINSIELAMMWDEVTITGQEVEVAEAMRILDKNLESLHFLTGMLSSGYFPARGGIVVGMRGQESRVPLGSMGDGMRRLMALSTSLAFSKSGCLFVDEIDTGLHYSVMSDMWKLIISKAIASGAQVFATTHSWDCIEGLSLLCQQQPELMSSVAIHKIDRVIPHSIVFAGESVGSMIKADIDPR